jgi:hypothetical protein
MTSLSLIICFLCLLAVITFALHNKGDVIVSMSLFRRFIKVSIRATDKLPLPSKSCEKSSGGESARKGTNVKTGNPRRLPPGAG